MKKNIFMAICVIAVVSCSKHDNYETVNNQKPSEVSSKVTVSDGKLQFSDFRQLDSTVNELLSLDQTGRQAWYDSIGFVSQESLWDQALEELDQIQDVESLAAFRQKHKSTFLFNDYTEDDLMPYLPCNKPAYSLVLNANGQVIVADTLRNCNFEDFSQTTYYASQQAFYAAESDMTKGRVTEVANSLYCENGKRKFWAESFRSGANVWIRFTAQKKNVFGWNHYKENYCSKLTYIQSESWKRQNVTELPTIINRSVWVGLLKAGHEVWVGEQPENMSIGERAKYGFVKRNYYIYSDDIGEPYGGTLRIDLPHVMR